MQKMSGIQHCRILTGLVVSVHAQYVNEQSIRTGNQMEPGSKLRLFQIDVQISAEYSDGNQHTRLLGFYPT